MTVAEAMKKMILLSNGNRHDINHFLKVHAYVAAIVHDIACPLCREKYGNTNGNYQQLEGAPLTRDFFAGTDIPADQLERIVWLVSHHHTLRPIEGPDHQILIEADYLVNAEESNLPESNIRHMNDAIFKTRTGKELLESVYLSH